MSDDHGPDGLEAEALRLYPLVGDDDAWGFDEALRQAYLAGARAVLAAANDTRFAPGIVKGPARSSRRQHVEEFLDWLASPGFRDVVREREES